VKQNEFIPFSIQIPEVFRVEKSVGQECCGKKKCCKKYKKTRHCKKCPKK
jgi:hypothetical protein